MRGKGFDYSFLDSMILNILKESSVPMPVLGISFKVNEKSGKIIGLNVIKHHLNALVDKKKVLKNIRRDDGIVHYTINKNCR
jgi:repressor of nif and glnA expression